MTMHNEIVSFIQSHYAADGVEVRAVGPKAITLVLPPELHDLGNLCGELEVQFNTRMDIVAQSTPGLGPTATVWVAQPGASAAAHASEEARKDDDVSDGDEGGCDKSASSGIDGTHREESEKGAADASTSSSSTWRRYRRCFQMMAAGLTAAAAAATLLRHGAVLLDNLHPNLQPQQQPHHTDL